MRSPTGLWRVVLKLKVTHSHLLGNGWRHPQLPGYPKTACTEQRHWWMLDFGEKNLCYTELQTIIEFTVNGRVVLHKNSKHMQWLWRRKLVVMTNTINIWAFLHGRQRQVDLLGQFWTKLQVVIPTTALFFALPCWIHFQPCCSWVLCDAPWLYLVGVWLADHSRCFWWTLWLWLFNRIIDFNKHWVIYRVGAADFHSYNEATLQHSF